MSDLLPGITVVIPTIANRAEQLKRALASVVEAAHYWGHIASLDPSLPETAKMTPEGQLVGGQFTLACEVVADEEHAGAAKTRHKGLMAVQTTHAALLDDDDQMLPDHLVKLYRAAIAHKADYVWSRFRIQYPDGSTLPGPAFLGEKAFSPWNDDDPCQTTITTLVNTEMAIACGGFAQFDDDGQEIDGQRRGEDHEFTLRMRAAGAVMHHVPEVTWLWHHWGEGKPGQPGNTSGLPSRW